LPVSNDYGGLTAPTLRDPRRARRHRRRGRRRGPGADGAPPDANDGDAAAALSNTMTSGRIPSECSSTANLLETFAVVPSQPVCRRLGHGGGLQSRGFRPRAAPRPRRRRGKS